MKNKNSSEDSLNKEEVAKKEAKEKSRRKYLKKLAGNPFNYFFGYATDSSLALFLIFFGAKSLVHDETENVVNALIQNLDSIVLWLVAGFFFWGLSEYFIHRYPYHHGETLIKTGHDLHHEEPKAPYAMPWYLTQIYAIAIWYSLIQIFPVLPISVFLAGWLIGFMYFRGVHYFQHCKKLKTKYYRSLKAFHDVHHHSPLTNFGVTNKIWDTVFHTKHRNVNNS